jgi:glyoxylase-like metal-dependent hydrolase (beta-lactamase superfamily II)
VNAIAIHAANPGGSPGPTTGTGNWTWLIPGRVPTLIDAGVGEPQHLDALEQALAGHALGQVFVTHGHADHASGAPAIASRMHGVRFRKVPWPERDAQWQVTWEALEEGASLQAGDTRLTAVHTPGHAPDHVCFWHAETRTLFGGDLVIQGTTVFIPAGLGGDLAAYLASLARVIALDPARILPAHGPLIENPVRLLRAYLDHRHAREAQIIDALRRGARDPDAIVAHVYRDLADALRGRARETVTAHLEKLEREGRTSRQGDAWHMIEA